jgi:hypothetical protein
MAGNEVKLTSGGRWTAQQFLDHYFKPTASGTPVPVAGRPAPVAVDMPWYMSEGPGRYYHPGMFPITDNLVDRRDLAPGRYDLWKLAPLNERDPSVKAGITHYSTDTGSEDYKTRALVFGDESARISGQVVVNPDGTKTFERVEIRPMDTNFDFHHNNWNRPHVELAREAARQKYDPENYGTSYEIEYRGHGRLGGRVQIAELGEFIIPLRTHSFAPLFARSLSILVKRRQDGCRVLPPLRLPRSRSIFNIWIKRMQARRRPPEQAARWRGLLVSLPVKIRR